MDASGRLRPADRVGCAAPPAAQASRDVHAGMIDSFFALRDGTYPVAKLPGVRRILLIGDSFLFGAGVAVGDALPAALERRLTDESPGVVTEVLGLARRGAALVDFPAYFERFLDAVGDEFAADLVVAVVNYTDGETQPLAVNGSQLPPELAWKFSSQRWRAWSRAVSRLALQSHRVGGRFALAYYDHLHSPGSPDAMRVLTELSRRRGVPLVDLCAPFRDAPASSWRVDDVDEHPNPATHDRAAQKLANALAQLNLIKTHYDDASTFDNWHRAALRLGESESQLRYRRRTYAARLNSITQAAIRERCRAALTPCEAGLRSAVCIGAIEAAVRHWNEVLSRVRLWDCKLEFALAELDAVALPSPCCRKTSVTAPSPAALINEFEHLNSTIRAVASVSDASSPVAALPLLRQPLGVLRHINQLATRCAMSSRVDDISARLAGLIRVAESLFDELRIAPLQRFLDDVTCDVEMRLSIDLTPRCTAARTLIVNWQPDLPYRALARESAAIGGAQRQTTVFDLPWAASGQLSFGGAIGEVEVHGAKLSCDAATTIALAPGDCTPHRRFRWVPPLGLLEPISSNGESVVWAAIRSL